jgi:hypothetical protein
MTYAIVHFHIPADEAARAEILSTGVRLENQRSPQQGLPKNKPQTTGSTWNR